MIGRAILASALVTSSSSLWAAGAVVDAPSSRGALDGERLGFFAGADFRLATGRCGDCPTPRAALWYFEDDLVAVPEHGRPVAGFADGVDAVADARRWSGSYDGVAPLPLPPLVWLGSPELIEHGRLSAGAATIMDGAGRSFPLVLVPKLSTNSAYYDASSAAFFRERPLRLRGRTVERDGGAVFEARTIWPEDLRLDDTLPARPLSGSERFDSLIVANGGGAALPPTQRVLWRNPKQHSFAGHPALAIVLSGAQGDDDEAHGGHFAVATGVVGERGDWSELLVNNFYNLDSVSEKGIVGAMVPMDNYLMDLNSGQAYYRPTDVLIVVLADGGIARRYQGAIERVYDHYYRHDFVYNHAQANCAGISMDTLRAVGWNVPRRGPTGYVKAMAAFLYLLATDRSVSAGEKTFDYLTEERTRLLPRVAFEASGEDALALVEGRLKRRPTPEEQALRGDVEAIVLVRLPQVPSSRALGTYPIGSFDEYRARVPKDRSKWKIVPVAPRPFPKGLREERATASAPKGR